MYPESLDILVCLDCIHCQENAHYGKCGDMDTAYCTLKDKPTDVMAVPCDDFKGE